jgi:hypothetical protein
MLANQCNAVKRTKSDIIIYSEDDKIIQDIPSIKSIYELTQNGVICYNQDLCYIPYAKSVYKESNFINLHNNIFYKSEKCNYSTDLDSYKNNCNLYIRVSMRHS